MSKTETRDATFTADALVRPEDLARVTGVSGKVIRAYMRQTYPRPVESKGATWVIQGDVANDVVTHFATRRAERVVTKDDAATS